VSSAHDARSKYARTVLLQLLVVLPLLLKNLTQMLSLFGLIGMNSEWRIFQLSALIQIREIGHIIREVGFILEIGYFQVIGYFREIGYFQGIDYF
jgi:hypothetical protein